MPRLLRLHELLADERRIWPICLKCCMSLRYPQRVEIVVSTDIVDTKARQVVLHVVRNYKIPTNLGTYLPTYLPPLLGR